MCKQCNSNGSICCYFYFLYFYSYITWLFKKKKHISCCKDCKRFIIRKQSASWWLLTEAEAKMVNTGIRAISLNSSNLYLDGTGWPAMKGSNILWPPLSSAAASDPGWPSGPRPLVFVGRWRTRRVMAGLCAVKEHTEHISFQVNGSSSVAQTQWVSSVVLRPLSARWQIKHWGKRRSLKQCWPFCLGCYNCSCSVLWIRLWVHRWILATHSLSQLNAAERGNTFQVGLAAACTRRDRKNKKE